MKREGRENLILKFLEKRKGIVTADEIAVELMISTKTVYRIIQNINQNSQSGLLILSESGRGYQLDYGQYLLQNRAYKEEIDYYSPKERRNQIKEKLLLSSPKGLNIYRIFEDYYVSESVIASDQRKMASELKAYNLKLIRKNRELSIVGNESNIRKAMFGLIKELDIIDLEELKNGSASNLNTHDVLFILGQMRNLEGELRSSIPYPYNINLFSHLYILMNRSRKVNLNQIAQEENLQNYWENLPKDLLLYEMAQKMIENIKRYLGQNLPNSEIIYLYQYLQATRFQGKTNLPINFTDEVREITQTYLTIVGNRLGINIHDEIIFLELAHHIKPMINRLLNHISIRNGLLEEIIATYGLLFKQVSEISKQISENYHYPVIDDNENAFITLYFAKILETQPQLKKVVIVCTTGIGTSELLKTKVAKKFPNLQIVDIVATRNLEKVLEEHQDIDMIITTIHLPQQENYPVVLVSALFNEADQKKIEIKLGELAYEISNPF